MTRAVLVTGVGGVVGYGVLRALRAHDAGLHVIGCDIYEHAVGRAWADDFLVAPLAKSEGWSSWLRETASATGVDLIIPTLDPELDRFLSEPCLTETLSARVALPGQKTLAAAQDKWLLHEVLHGDATQILSCLDHDFHTLVETLGLPFIVKPRSGYGSRGVTRVDSAESFAAICGHLGDDWLAQQLVGTHDEEYTVGVFGDGRGEVSASITLQRWLSAEGTTMRARSREPIDAIDAAVARVTQILQPAGAVNLQFRLKEGLPKLLEVNARISSSTSIRAALGYNEAGMVVDYLLDGRLPTQPEIRHGEVTRYLEDQVTYR